MISAHAREVVEQSGANRRISMIVTIDAGAELRDIAMISDRKQRGAKLNMFLKRKKKPLLVALRRYEGVGLRVVDDLSGTPNLIFSAPARVWKRVMREQPQLAKNARIRIDADAPDFVSSGAVSQVA